MSSVLENDPAALYELSRRVDATESELHKIRENNHKTRSEQSGVVLALKEIDHNIENIYGEIPKICENQRSLSQKFTDSEKEIHEEIDKRVSPLEETNMKIKMISSNKTLILLIAGFLIIMGAIMEDVFRITLPERMTKSVTQNSPQEIIKNG